MSSAVWKFPLAGGYTNTISMPAGAVILSAAFQGEHLVLWALVNTDPDSLANRKPRVFYVYGTGHQIDEAALRFVDTAFIGALVFHVFEVPS